MIYAITVWLLLTTGLSMEMREFPTLAECEAYRRHVSDAVHARGRADAGNRRPDRRLQGESG